MSFLKNNLINTIKNYFIYSPDQSYSFTLSSAENQELYTNENSASSCKTNNRHLARKTSTKTNLDKIYSSLNVNLDFLKVKYNTLINSDIIIRQFSLIAKGKEFKAFLLYIDGMINSTMINDFVLKPLMLRNKSNTYSDDNSSAIAVSGNITVRRRKKFSIEDYIYNCLIPQNSITRETDFTKVISDVNSGNCALFVDTIETAFSIEVKGFQTRNVSSPNNEIVVHGAQEAFVEAIRTNTSLLRRIINNENLVIESTSVGKITRTKVAICYMKNIANDSLVSEVKYRINNLEIDSLISSRRT